MPRDTPSLRLKCSPTVRKFHKGSEGALAVYKRASVLRRTGFGARGLVGQAGFEPATSSFKGRCPDQTGPLTHTNSKELATGQARFELAFSPYQHLAPIVSMGMSFRGNCQTGSNILRLALLNDCPVTNLLYEISVPTHSVLCLAPRIFGAPYLVPMPKLPLSLTCRAFWQCPKRDDAKGGGCQKTSSMSARGR